MDRIYINRRIPSAAKSAQRKVSALLDLIILFIMQKEQLINWIANVIRKNLLLTLEHYELEAKFGKFIPKNYHSRRYLEGLQHLTQLNKAECQYEFQSKVAHEAFNQAFEKCKENGAVPKCINRLDLIFNQKEQRSSFVLNQEKECTAVLIQKKKSAAQHIDLVFEAQTHFRVSLSTERELSTSLKDILQQLPQRQNNIGMIRLKETTFLVVDNLEFAFSKVSNIKKGSESFPLITQALLDCKVYNIENCLKQIIEDHAKNPDFEVELEVLCPKELKEQLKGNDQKAKELANSFYEKILKLGESLLVEQQGEQKKVKVY